MTEKETTTVGSPLLDRVVPVVAIIIVVISAWYGIRWQFGNMFGELTDPMQDNAKELAAEAERLAPSDPVTAWLSATAEKGVFTVEALEQTVIRYQDTVRKGPNDFRWWLELARAQEQAENYEAAEKAYIKGRDLAPFYTYPQWQLGNFYLRQGRADEAFAELKKTTENSDTYRSQVFALAWDYYDNDPARVESVMTENPTNYAALAAFYANRGRAADAVRIWERVPQESRGDFTEQIKGIARGLFEKKEFKEALTFAVQSGMDPDGLPETITNGDFEKPITTNEQSLFNWVFDREQKEIQISTDSSVKHDGKRSLKLVYKNMMRPWYHNAIQAVAVEPSTAYRLSFWVRTENLRSAGPPMIEIVNANTGEILTATEPFQVGSADWSQVNVAVNTPENCEAIIIRSARMYCGDECGINGIVWYDGFSLSK